MQRSIARQQGSRRRRRQSFEAARLTKKGLDQPAFNRDRLKAEKLIDSKVLEQLIRVQVDAGCSS